MTRAARTRLLEIGFQGLTLSANLAALLFLGALLYDVFARGLPNLSWDFLTGYPSRNPGTSGVLSAIAGTIIMMFVTAAVAVPTGIGAAVYLEEYAKNTRWVRLVKLNIMNLAGVPSIVYGILGLTIFVRGMSLGRSLLAGSLTMALVILPMITITAQEALRAVPQSLRLAGFGIGMTRWQVIRHNVLPSAVPGMMTGVILALSRAIGESAPLLMMGALQFVAFLPASLMDSFTVLPIQIFNWASRPQKGFHDIAASGIIVLMVILLGMNAAAIIVRNRYQKKGQSRH